MKPGQPDWLTDWATAWPRPAGDWTVGADRRWGVLDPESGEVRVVDPAADSDLVALAHVLGRGRLVSYRSGRRAVVSAEATWIKVLRPKRLQAALTAYATIGELDLPGLVVPEVVAWDGSGWFEITSVPGVSLNRVIVESASAGSAGAPVEAAIETAAAGVRLLHQAGRPAGVGGIDLGEYVPDDPGRWVDIVGRADPAAAPVLAEIAERLAPWPDGGTSVVHADLHDKNVMIGDEGPGLIDIEGCRIGRPEVDLANLAVHLELRALQAGLAEPIGAGWAERLVSAYGTTAVDVDAMATIRSHTWFRLGCLYRFRRSGIALAAEITHRATQGRTDNST